MRLVLLVAAFLLFLIAAACDWGWLNQTHEAGFIALGLAGFAGSFIPWRG